ncbi:MAG: baseplate J/gp47 family protein [Phascolarctobacterium sp.]|nr:baseplate J/gp47 family protein [Phascolarctobacterium sp.]
MSLNNLPEVVFVDADAEKVESAVIASYENITGRTLAKGDPVRLLLLTFANIIILLMNCINETGKQNLLRYAEGSKLDHLGALLGVKRIAAKPATTTMRITLSSIMATNVIIPEGTRFTADGKIYFALDETMIISAGQSYAEGTATCTVTGIDGNDFVAGQIKTLVDPVAYVADVTNITKSEGGADVEADESYREAIHIAPESFSVAGPIGAYEYFAKRASATISDVAVSSPNPGEVDVRVLLEGGVIPGEEMLRAVEEVLSDKNVRPLTDLVSVQTPDIVNYDIDITYYIDEDSESQESAIRAKVETAVTDFALWEKSKIGRDVNPSELIRRILVAGAKRVEVRSPAYSQLDATQVAVENSVTAEYGGVESA